VIAVKPKIKKLVLSKKFELFISSIILINCILIGVETYFSTPLISKIQNICLIIFVVEISMRFLARDSTTSFFKDPWNNSRIYFEWKWIYYSLESFKGI
jgi:voltage-gated sodium channel